MEHIATSQRTNPAHLPLAASPALRAVPDPSAPVTTLREDVIAVALSALLVLGLYLDGWNHINLQSNELGAFLTPWHGLLYLGFTATALWTLTRCELMNPRRALRGAPSMRELWAGTPVAYRLGLVGMGLATVAVPGDAIWHELFGVEAGVARVIGPFHLVLFTAIGLLVSCPLAAAWGRSDTTAPGWRELRPAVASIALIGAVAAFVLQWSASFVRWQPGARTGDLSATLAASPDVVETLHSHGVASVLLTTVALIAPLALGWARFDLPVGACTAVTGTVAVLSAALNEFSAVSAILPAVVGGAAGDAVAAFLRPGPARPHAKAATAACIALTTWLSFFALLRWTEGVAWPRDVWLGAVTAATLMAALVALAVNRSPRV